MGIIKKVIRRCRIKRLFKRYNCGEMYRWIICSYNSCKVSNLEDKNLLELVLSGILVCVEGDMENQNIDTYRRIRMNTQLFRAIIF